MKERPILFSGPMVQAIIAGQKTQTRRVMKPQPWFLPEAYDRFSGWMWTRDGTGDGEGLAWGSEADMLHVSYSLGAYCPYGKPGDLLWVRETWAALYPGKDDVLPTVNPRPAVCSLAYAATEERGINGGWTPSIHMPRWASRITLEIVSVRVQRLQDITEEDAKAEGCTGEHFDLAVNDFIWLWGSINGKREGYDWESNPWVWAVTFRAVKA